MTELFVNLGRLPRNGARVLLPAHKQDEDALAKLPSGQPLRVRVGRVRNPEFHRLYFALLNYAYENWEPSSHCTRYKGQVPEKNFERFRKDLTILAGFYDVTFSVGNQTCLQPKSISFSSMDEDEFHDLYTKTIDVIVKHVLTTYTGDDLREVMSRIEEFE